MSARGASIAITPGVHSIGSAFSLPRPRLRLACVSACHHLCASACHHLCASACQPPAVPVLQWYCLTAMRALQRRCLTAEPDTRHCYTMALGYRRAPNRLWSVCGCWRIHSASAWCPQSQLVACAWAPRRVAHLLILPLHPLKAYSRAIDRTHTAQATARGPLSRFEILHTTTALSSPHPPASIP
jgi:hypothetical protein